MSIPRGDTPHPSADSISDSGLRRRPGGGPCGRTWSQAAGRREVSAKLAALPADVELRDDFPEPITFDPQRKLLLYRGEMYHSSYLYLETLSSEPAFARAIEELFTASAMPPPTPRKIMPMVMAGVISLLLLGSALVIGPRILSTLRTAQPAAQ